MPKVNRTQSSRESVDHRIGDIRQYIINRRRPDSLALGNN